MSPSVCAGVLAGGAGRPESTDPEVVSGYVLGSFREPGEEVRALIERAAGELDRLGADAP